MQTSSQLSYGDTRTILADCHTVTNPHTLSHTPHHSHMLCRTLNGLTLARSMCTCALLLRTPATHALPLTHPGCGFSAGHALDVTEAAAPPRRTKAVERGSCPGTTTPVLTGRTAAPVYQRLQGKPTASAFRDPQKSHSRFSPRVPARPLTTTPVQTLPQDPGRLLPQDTQHAPPTKHPL